MKCFYLLLLFCIARIGYGQDMNKLAQTTSFLQSLPSAFEENNGQVWDKDNKTASYVKYHYQQGGINIFMLPTGIAYQFNKAHYPEGYDLAKKDLSLEDEKKQEALRAQIRLETYRMDMTLVGANPNAVIIAEGKSKDYVNYYNRNALKVHSFSRLRYKDIYPGIDWVVYTTNQGLKYDFIVQPGADPNQIQLQFKDHEGLRINKDGSFTLSNSMGAITEQAPVSFQGNKEVLTKFEQKDNTIRFQVSKYDKSQVLIIDPSLQWATYYGGNSLDQGYSCTTDNLGNVYLAGGTVSTNNIASGGHQSTHGGGLLDAFLVKFSSNGVRLWATYYGGNNDDRGYSCTTDNLGNVYLAGWTVSTSNIASGGYQNTHGGNGNDDAFLVKFNSSGVRQWASYYGGSSDDYGYSCATDNLGNVYLAGQTRSNSNIASGGHQNIRYGSHDAFLVKFNSSGIRQWGTYYGGSSYDYGWSCAIDNLGNVYLAGETRSNSNIASGGHQNTHGGNGSEDAFLVKFSSNGVRIWATYYGGNNDDRGFSCTTDNLRNVYLAGWTESVNYTNNIAVGGHQNSRDGSLDAFLVKFNSSGIRQWGTYYGGSSNDYAHSCATDNLGNVYLAGRTESVNHINKISAGGHQNTYGSSGDAFLVKFNNSGVRQWATYYGGNNPDYGRSCATDNLGNVYLAGYAQSTNNIAAGGHQNTYGSSEDAFLAKFHGSACSPITSTTTLTVCDSYTWIDGNTYTTSNNTATHTLTNAAGCDSVITLNLTINHSNAGVDMQTACDSYTWIDGNTYTSSNNTATHTLTNAAGCDSVVTLNLTINHSNAGTDVHTACDSYTWIDGNTYTSSNNTATHTLTNAAGCDSVVTLNLTINHSNSGTDVQTTCDSYTWIDGNTYTTSNNTATHTLTNAAGCDSIIILNLTINHSNTGVDVHTACDSYTWIDGNTYTSSNNTATHTLTNAAGCDSIITLNLTINHSNAGTDVHTACDSYTWIDGNTYTASNTTATHTLTNAAGCDSIVTLNLTISHSNAGTDVHTACDSYTWIDGNTYTSSNNTATHTLTNAAGCDSVVTLNLTINTVDTSLTVAGSTITANATGATYQWLNCDSNYVAITGEIAASFTTTANGLYSVAITQNGCVDTSRCIDITVIGINHLNALYNEVLVYPNPTSGQIKIDLGSLTNVTLRIIGVNGRVLYQEENINQPIHTMNLNYPAGVYFIEVNAQGKIAQYKVIKQND